MTSVSICPQNWNDYIFKIQNNPKILDGFSDKIDWIELNKQYDPKNSAIIMQNVYKDNIMKFIDNKEKEENKQQYEKDLFRYFFHNEGNPEITSKTSRVQIDSEFLKVSEDIQGRVECNYSGAVLKGDKASQGYLQDTYNEFLKKIGCYTYMITCVITPSECNKGESWDLINYRKEKLINFLKCKYPQIKFIVSSIEEHTSHKTDKSNKSKKEEGKQEEQEEDSESIITDNPTNPEPQENSKKSKHKKLKEEKSYVFNVPPEAQKQEVIRVFSERNEDLIPSEAKYCLEILHRIINFLIKDPNISNSLEHIKYFVSLLENPNLTSDLIPSNFWEYTYQLLVSKGGFLPENPKLINLNGYAHLHMVVFINTTDGSKIPCVNISNEIRKSKIFIDIDVRDGKDEENKGDKAIKNALSYCLKNNRHKGAFTKLGLKNPCKIHNWNKDKIVNEYFLDLLATPGCKVIIDGVLKREEVVIYSEPVEFKQTVLGKANENHDKDFIPIAQTKEDKMINFVNKFLQDNEMAFGGDGFIYKKVRGSKNTYSYYMVETDADVYRPCDYKLFTAEMTSTSEGRKFFPKMESEYLFYASKPNQKVFRKILVNCEWLEFKDFFVHIPKKLIVREQYDYPAFQYIHNVSYSDIELVKTNKKKPEKWLKILENSGYIDNQGNPIELNGTFLKISGYNNGNIIEEPIPYTVDGKILISDLYRLLSPKMHKSKVIVIYGDSNCGKTTLIAPFLRILPKGKVGTCGKSNGFEMSNFLNKLLVVMDEASVSSLGLGRSQLLQIYEGNALMNVNAKNKDPVSTRINTNVTVMTNSLKWAQVVPGSDLPSVMVPQAHSSNIDSAYASRCNFYPFKSLEGKAEVGIKEYIESEERGLVFLYLLIKSSEFDPVNKIQEINDKETLHYTIESYKRSRQFDEMEE